jgi:PAS domain S-box-containing protein
MAGREAEDPLAAERFREIADALPVGLWRIDSTFQHDWANKHWLDFTGGRLEDEVIFGWVDKVHPDDRDRVLEEFDRAFDEREASTVEYRVLGRDGHYRWFFDSGAPFFRDGVFAGFTGCCVDITERKEAEGRTQALQAEIIRRSRLEAMSTLGAAIVHEVSQPLQAIAFYADALERRIRSGADLPADLGEAASAIKEAVVRAREIVRNCRSLASGEAGERVPQDLSDILRSVESLVRLHPSATGSEMTWEIPDGLECVVNRIQIEQVVFNLVVNAVQSMRGSPARSVTISAAAWGSQVVVSVADRGHGIPVDSRASIFEPAVTGREDGMGFGLYISKLIVSDHGGRIWVDENIGGGSVFRFTLPLNSEGKE